VICASEAKSAVHEYFIDYCSVSSPNVVDENRNGGALVWARVCALVRGVTAEHAVRRGRVTSTSMRQIRSVVFVRLIPPGDVS